MTDRRTHPPVIFLDIDGVLNSGQFYVRRRGAGIVGAAEQSHRIDPDAVGHLNDIIAETLARVVISSTWRHGLNADELQDILTCYGFRGTVIGVTPCVSTHTERGQEIQAWLDSRPDVTRFVILDDDSDMAHLRARLIQTTHEVGLTARHVEQAVRLLLTPYGRPDAGGDCYF